MGKRSKKNRKNAKQRQRQPASAGTSSPTSTTTSTTATLQEDTVAAAAAVDTGGCGVPAKSNEEEKACTSVSTPRGWRPGFGGLSNATKREKRDARRIKEAIGTRASVGIPDYEASQQRVQELSGKDTLRLELYNNFLDQQQERWRSMHHAICREHVRGEWPVIEAKWNALLEEIEQARSRFGINKQFCVEIGLFVQAERTAYTNRALAKRSGPKRNFKGAVQDLTEALLIARAGKAGDSEQLESAEIIILFHRAQCLYMMDDTDRAVIDLRACHAGLRSMGDNWDGPRALPNRIVVSLLTALAQQKLKAGHSRPLFTDEERRSLEKDLGLNAYDQANYQCYECGAHPSTVRLQRCARCQHKWFCSKECQIKAWKNGHKYYCEEPLGLIECQDTCRESVKRILETETHMGMACINTEEGQPRVILCDVQTGRLYESLTNEDIFFLPSEKSTLWDAKLSKPPDGFDEKNLMNYLRLDKEQPLFVQETDFLKSIQHLLSSSGPVPEGYLDSNRNVPVPEGYLDSNRNVATLEAEEKATSLLKSLHDALDGDTDLESRTWAVLLNMITVYMYRSWSRLLLEKYDQSMEDVAMGLSFVTTFWDWARNLSSAGTAGPSLKARLLFIRSQCQKRLTHFDKALSDLWDCRNIIQFLGENWTSGKPCLFDFFALDLNIVTRQVQIVMAVKKVRDHVARPHYSTVEGNLLQKRLGLALLQGDRESVSFTTNKTIGKLDPWAYANYGVFVAADPGGKERVLVSGEKDGEYFESLTDKNAIVQMEVGIEGIDALKIK